ncbi:MAG TPA: hypothetical protein VFK41_07215 [Nocardioidaceae bacterium]|nr:hypothetical protein [Nocardioidaceae bacterium]
MTAWGSAVALLLAVQPHVVLTFQDERIAESSALVDGGDVVYTINDSGDSARVFAVAKGSGETVGVTTYSDDDVVDVEALAPGPDGDLWVGDIGDNNHVRDHLTLYRIPRPGVGDTNVEAQVYELVYADGPRDAETLLVHPRTGRVYLVSKGILGGTVYVAPPQLRTDRTNVLRPVGSTGGLVTDGVFLRDGKHVLLRNYGSATVLRTQDFTPVATFPLPAQPQGEGIGISGHTVLVSTEGARTAVRALPLPQRVVRLLDGTPTASASPVPGPGPGPVPGAAPDDAGKADGPWGGNVVPLALGAAWVVLLVLGIRAFRRRSRHTP